MNITGSKRFLWSTCVCKSIRTSKSCCWASEVCQTDSQKPWDHVNLTFPVRSHLSGALWTEINPLNLKAKVKARRTPQHSQDCHYNSKEELPAMAVSSAASIGSKPLTPVIKQLSWKQGGHINNPAVTTCTRQVKLVFPSSLPQIRSSSLAHSNMKAAVRVPSFELERLCLALLTPSSFSTPDSHLHPKLLPCSLI